MSVIPRVRIADVVGETETWNPGLAPGNESFTYIDISSIDSVQKSIRNAETILARDAPSRARQLVKSGDVLVSTVRPNLNAVALVPDSFDGATVSTGFSVLRPNRARLEARYLFHWVQSPDFIRFLTSRAMGASYPAVTERIVRESDLPVPSLADQRRIASVLDTACGIRWKQRERLRVFDEFLRSVFRRMFENDTSSVAMPSPSTDWPSVTLESVAATSANACAGGPFGSSLTRADYIARSGVPVIRGNNLLANIGTFRDEGFVFITEDKANELRRNVALPGDVIFTQRGTLGQVAQIPFEAKYPRYIVSQSQMKVTLNDAVVDPIYLVHYFLSQRARVEIGLRTLATGVPHINLSILKAFPIVLPPVAMQRDFATFASRHAASKERIESACREGQHLVDSLSDRFFRVT